MDENLKVENNSAVLSINPKLYPLEAFYSAAYVFLDKAYIILDGDPEKEVLVKIKPKEGQDPEKLGNEFLNELINYADYQKRAEQTKKIREMLLQRALITNDPSIVEDNGEVDELLKELEDEDYPDDPEGIAVPWEEKYGNEAKEKENKDENKAE
jgi:His-Xaa-Ser system protein HxsD